MPEPTLKEIADDASAQAVHKAKGAAQAVEIAREAQMASAIHDGVSLMPELLEAMKTEIAVSVRLVVNGKIDKIDAKLDAHNAQHETDMIRIMPALLAYEDAQRFAKDAQRSGKVVIWIAGTITAIGSAYLIVMQILFSK